MAEQVEEFERRRKIATETCLSKTVFPCSADGKRPWMGMPVAGMNATAKLRFPSS